MVAYSSTTATTGSQLIAQLGRRLAAYRLSRNLPQEQLSADAGVHLNTIRRLEDGANVSLDTLVRVLIALKLDDHLLGLVPDPAVRPIDRVALAGHERQRARPKKGENTGPEWSWGGEEGE